MKLLIATIALWALNGYAQTTIFYSDTIDIDTHDEIPCHCECNDDVYEIVDQEPEFPGGYMALNQYLIDTIEIPKIWEGEMCISGTTYVQFVVNKNGCISDVQIIRGLFDSFDQAVINAIKAMPPWKPGIKDGRRVRVRYTIPVHLHYR